MANSEEITMLLLGSAGGNHDALQQFSSVMYNELRRLAHARLRRERPEQTLQTTALVHEAYLRLAGQHGVRWQSRAHFFAVAAKMMRRILIDYARRRQFVKRGGGAVHVSLDPVELGSERAVELTRLDDALTALAVLDKRQSNVVELRFFAGLSIEETAEALGVSPGTVMRDWTLAKAWLQRELRHGE